MPRPIQIIAQEYIDLFEAPLFLHTNVKSALFDGIHSDIVESISNLLGVEIMRNNTFGYFTEVCTQFIQILMRRKFTPIFITHPFL